MQRIEIKFSQEEYNFMKEWNKGGRTTVEEIEKEVFVKSEKEKVFFNFSRANYGAGIVLKVKSNKGYLINNSIGIYVTEIVFRRVSNLMGVFSLYNNRLEREEAFINFTREYEESKCHKSYREGKESELNTAKYFTWNTGVLNLFNTVKYFDFENKKELSIAMFSYINYVYNYDKVDEIEEFIKIKLEMLGYERNSKLKNKRPIYEKKDEVNLKTVSLKSLDYALENLLEVFYKIISSDIEEHTFRSNGINEDMSCIVGYSYRLAEYYTSNSNHESST